MNAPHPQIAECALELASRGWRIHPIKQDKKAILNEWQKIATTDETIIREWYEKWPQAGIGIATGAASNLVIIDIDVKDDGESGLLKLEQRFGNLPKTITVKTGGGGRQLYYSYPSDCEIRNKVRLLGIKGVDVRGEGGYVVAPPSLHPSGNRYEWGTESETIAELPQHWRFALMKQASPDGVMIEAKPGGPKGPLRDRTKSFIRGGAEQGERNQRLYEAACELAGAGYTRDEAEPYLTQGASRSTPPIDRSEVMATLSSAFSKPRTAWAGELEVGDIPHNGDSVRPVESPQLRHAIPADEKPGPTAPGPAARVTIRPYLSNYINDPTGGDEAEEANYAKPIQQIAKELQESCGNEPKLVQGQLFVLGEYDRMQIPGQDSLRFIGEHEELFTWLHERVELNWPSSVRKGMRSLKTKKAITPVSRREIFEHLKATVRPMFVSVEVLPHVPAVENAYYIPFEVPRGDGQTLREFMDNFNAETELDRNLAVAALLTPAWGGPPGARPAFIFQSDWGRGSGKTKTAELICEIYGGCFTIDPETKDWKEVKARLLSDDSLSTRCVLIDNVKNRLHGAQIESLITAKWIDGKKMYVGQFRRPNRLTYFITSNSPKLSKDLADRSVFIKMGRQKHQNDWEAWALDFIKNRRVPLLADIYSVLSEKPCFAIDTKKRDRWGLWQDEILSRIGGSNQIADLIRERRKMVDMDSADAAAMADAIENELVQAGIGNDGKAAFFTSPHMHKMAIDAGVAGNNMGDRAVRTRLDNLREAIGPLAGLSYGVAKLGGKAIRGFYWCRANCNRANGFVAVPEPTYGQRWNNTQANNDEDDS